MKKMLCFLSAVALLSLASAALANNDTTTQNLQNSAYTTTAAQDSALTSLHHVPQDIAAIFVVTSRDESGEAAFVSITNSEVMPLAIGDNSEWSTVMVAVTTENHIGERGVNHPRVWPIIAGNNSSISTAGVIPAG